jgi:hypothetical protein
MKKNIPLIPGIYVCLVYSQVTHAKAHPSKVDMLINFPSSFLYKVRKKIAVVVGFPEQSGL